MFCPECGSELLGAVPKFCNNCGSAVPSSPGEGTDVPIRTQAERPMSSPRAPRKAQGPPPAGFYADPYAPGSRRYWSGTRWVVKTTDTKEQEREIWSGRTLAPQGPVFDSGNAGSPADRGRPAPVEPPRRRRGARILKAAAWVVLALAVVAGIAVLAVLRPALASTTEPGLAVAAPRALLDQGPLQSSLLVTLQARSPASVWTLDCPRDVPLQWGHVFACTATASDGTVMTFTVTQTDGVGGYVVSGPDPA